MQNIGTAGSKHDHQQRLLEFKVTPFTHPTQNKPQFV